MLTFQTIAAQPTATPSKQIPYRVVDTGQRRIFSNSSQLTIAPKPGQPFFGQDGFYDGPQPSYHDNGDGTVTDLNTGLMWVQARGAKVPWNEAVAGAARTAPLAFSSPST